MLYIVYTVLLPIDPFDYIYKKKLSDTKMAATLGSNTNRRPTLITTFTAHDSRTRCLRIGPKSGKVLVTGGDDRRVNLWALGKPTPILVSNERIIWRVWN